MDWQRVIGRNGLAGGYDTPPDHHGPGNRMIAGDLRRLEHDQRDAWHLERYALAAGITPDQAKAVLDALFDASLPYPPHEATTETNALRRQLEQAQQYIETLRGTLQSLHAQCHYRKTLEAVHEQFHHLDDTMPRVGPSWTPLFYTREEEAERSQ